MSNIDGLHITNGTHLGNVLKLLRIEAGMSLREAAQATEISFTRLSNVEHNERHSRLSLDELCKLVAGYGREISL